LSGKVARPWAIQMKYQNESFETVTNKFSGMTARVILHEYDHIQGILYKEHLSALSKKLMESKLKKIAKGKIKPNYKTI
jgi:peptide deformylase